MKWWVRFGCFLTGYNFNILNASSEVSAKSLKRYTSAMIIVCIIWAFVGFFFSSRYLMTGIFGSLVGALVLCLIVIQIERQIILSTNLTSSMRLFRVGIGIVMALIGSIIVDQIIFQKDIELGKIKTLNKKVNEILPERQKEIKSQIDQITATLDAKDAEVRKIREDVSLHPTIKSVTSQTSLQPVVTTTRDSSNFTKESVNVVRSNNVTTSSIANPNIALIEPLNKQITELRQEKNAKESLLIKLRSDVEDEIKGKTGFLDELVVMMDLVFSSFAAFIIWCLWLFFLVCIELFVLFSKSGEEENDYDLTIKHHMALQKRKLYLMAQATQDTN